MRRIIAASLALVLVFAVIIIRMNTMVQTLGETYTQTASNKSTKTITTYGMRGTIYDKNMNPLAYDRVSYNVTFYRDPSRSSAEDRKAYTQVLIKTIELIEANGKTTVNDFWMKKNDEGKWVFSAGAATEAAEASRKKQWSTNFSLTTTAEDRWWNALQDKYSIPEDLDDDMKVKVLALWQESRMNAFNSTPCVIAYDSTYDSRSGNSYQR